MAATTFELDDRQPAYRVFSVGFLVAALVLGVASTRVLHAELSWRALIWGANVASLVLAVSLARAPWRLHTVVREGAAEHTAHRLAGHATVAFKPAEVEAVEVVAKAPVRAFVVLRDGRRLEALRPWADRRAVDDVVKAARPRCDALARALGTRVRVV